MLTIQNFKGLNAMKCHLYVVIEMRAFEGLSKWSKKGCIVESGKKRFPMTLNVNFKKLLN